MPDTAVTPVDSATLEGSQAAAVDLSVFSMFMNADIVVQAIMLMLLLASFWSWAIIFEKTMRFKSVRQKSERFEKEFWNSDALDKLQEKTKKRANHPMAQVFLAAMDEWFRSRMQGMGSPAQKANLRERITLVMQVARSRELERLENGLGFLATVGSAAPFVGLFGTVWGIMNSFQSIAVSKNTSLAVVAPGIAEALFATAIGLFAAIPAVIAYNKFSGELDRFAGKLEDFSLEFNALFSRQIDSAAAA